MKRKIPADAFEYYVALGAGRSYEAVAQRYGVTKRAVVKLAERENWQERLKTTERKVRERVDGQMAESLEAMQARHLKTLQAVLGRALEALRSMPLTSSMDAVRAIEMVLRQERAIRGEGDASFEELERRIRGELDFVMVSTDVDEDKEWTSKDERAAAG